MKRERVGCQSTSNDNKVLTKRMVRTSMSNKITYGFFDLVVVNGDSWTRVFTAWYHSMKETKKKKEN